MEGRDGRTFGGDDCGLGWERAQRPLTVCGTVALVGRNPSVLEKVALSWSSPSGSDHTVVIAPVHIRATGGPNEMPSDPTSTAPPGIRADGVADPELAGAVGAQASSRPSEPVAKAVFPPASTAVGITPSGAQPRPGWITPAYRVIRRGSTFLGGVANRVVRPRWFPAYRGSRRNRWLSCVDSAGDGRQRHSGAQKRRE